MVVFTGGKTRVVDTDYFIAVERNGRHNPEVFYELYANYSQEIDELNSKIIDWLYKNVDTRKIYDEWIATQDLWQVIIVFKDLAFTEDLAGFMDYEMSANFKWRTDNIVSSRSDLIDCEKIVKHIITTPKN